MTNTLPRRIAGLLLCLALLALAVLLSLAVGARAIPFSTVVDALWHSDGSPEAVIVTTQRVPRTILGLLIGMALGLAGAVMQALTRNPLADPGLLGVNSGAAAAVVTAISFFGITTASGYVWFAFAGAAAATVVVYLLGAGGKGPGGPVRLALAGTSIGAVLVAYTYGVQMLDAKALDQFRFWIVGGLSGRDQSVLLDVLPFLVAGIVIALLLSRPLNALSLGEDTGRALGVNLAGTRLASAATVTLLCGAATAAAGPFAFIGLAVPHAARALIGADLRWVLPYAMLLAPVLLLGADVVGRVVITPSELEAGIVTALVGAPVLIALVRRRQVVPL
ncbi:FecCD family ABC transporter permease [Actinoplanes hulinensis]|uniref:FecCD family ABC transporter permease n=1 Tax=Actinoplanes hulinensis TaxID=1144547 RepID=UPI0027E317D2|nr:iron chelate uptake ABC transporter family permease subunit [Actinoplanes hulinensis]